MLPAASVEDVSAFTFRRAIALIVVLAACGGSAVPLALGEELPPTSPEQIQTLIAQTDTPVVVNVWASWCIPCRSEAPLLVAAYESLGDQIRFVGVDVSDSQRPALEFLAEFGIEYENYFDPNRSVPASLGRQGVPLTFFFKTNGELSYAHPGVIDERTLALRIDELLEG